MKKANWGASAFWILLTISLVAHARHTTPSSTIGSKESNNAFRSLSNVKQGPAAQH
jgi:hypothetical protein